MKKIRIMVVVLAVFGVLMVANVDAAQWCWQIESTPPTFIRLEVIKPNPNSPIWSLNGMWYNPAVFVNPLVGTMVKSVDGSERKLGLYGTEDFFAYKMHARIDATTKNGTLYIYTIDTDTYVLYDLTRVNCSTLPLP